VEEIATLPHVETHIVSTTASSPFEEWPKREASAIRAGIFSGTRPPTRTQTAGARGGHSVVIEMAKLDDTAHRGQRKFLYLQALDFARTFSETGATRCCARLGDIKRSSFGVAKLGRITGCSRFVEKPKAPPSDVGVYALFLYAGHAALIRNTLTRATPGRPRPLPGIGSAPAGRARLPL
jgi:hypothetical protein